MNNSDLSLPHVALMMDGNGRWAERRGLPRALGHQAGLKAMRRLIKHAVKLQLEYLTLFSFSSENWSRPLAEVQELMRLLRRYVRSDLAELKSNNVRVKIIGARHNLPREIADYLYEAEQATDANTGLQLIVAFNYGGRDEICRAVQSLADEVANGVLSAEHIDEALIEARLDTAGIPSPDLIIRTSGEYRVSNFLLWQSAYAEFFFTETLWPDFTEKDFDIALSVYAKRQRRFGGLPQQASVAS